MPFENFLPVYRICTLKAGGVCELCVIIKDRTQVFGVIKKSVQMILVGMLMGSIFVHFWDSETCLLSVCLGKKSYQVLIIINSFYLQHIQKSI